MAKETILIFILMVTPGIIIYISGLREWGWDWMWRRK